MQRYCLILAGLETAYLRKLALYLQRRIYGSAQVCVWEDEKDPSCGRPDAAAETDCIWIGTERTRKTLQDRRGSEEYRFVLLTEEPSVNGVFAFQSREILARQLLEQCEKQGICLSAVSAAACWIALYQTGAEDFLPVFTFTYAQILGEEHSVLVIDLTALSGWELLFGMRPEQDLSDLILALRGKAKTVRVESCTCRVGSFDWMAAPRNPAVLSELTAEDMRAVITAVETRSSYEYILVCLGLPIQGLHFLVQAASRFIHLQRRGITTDCRARVWEEYLRQCGCEDVKTEHIPTIAYDAEMSGEALIQEWVQSPVGDYIRRHRHGKEPRNLSETELEEGGGGRMKR